MSKLLALLDFADNHLIWAQWWLIFCVGTTTTSKLKGCSQNCIFAAMNESNASWKSPTILQTKKNKLLLSWDQSNHVASWNIHHCMICTIFLVCNDNKNANIAQAVEHLMVLLHSGLTYCWWSFWILFVLFKSVWTEWKWETGNHQFSQDWNDLSLAISSKIKSSSSTLERYHVLCWNWRFWKILDPKILIEDPDHMLVHFNDLSPGLVGRNDVWHHHDTTKLLCC